MSRQLTHVDEANEGPAMLGVECKVFATLRGSASLLWRTAVTGIFVTLAGPLRRFGVNTGWRSKRFPVQDDDVKDDD